MAIDSKAANEPLTGVTPHLTVKDAPDAIEFYKRAFGAEEVHRMVADDGKRIMHACVMINGHAVMMADYFGEYCGAAPDTPRPLPEGVTLHLKVDDTDRWFDRAVAAGAEPAMPPADMFWGDRYGQVRDPSGHTWAMGSPIKKAG